MTTRTYRQTRRADATERTREATERALAIVTQALESVPGVTDLG